MSDFLGRGKENLGRYEFYCVTGQDNSREKSLGHSGFPRYVKVSSRATLHSSKSSVWLQITTKFFLVPQLYF